MTNILIKDIDDLKHKAFRKDGDFSDFYISIAGGIARSGKRIKYEPEYDEFQIIHEIDDTYEEFKTTELKNKSNLIEAIEKKALYFLNE